MPKKIWIDAGHGGSASGATAHGRMEKTDNLTYALELDRQFRAQGFATVLTRSTDKYIDLNIRTAQERREKCDLAISCHRNAASTTTANGFEVWLHSAAPQSYITWASDMAQGIATMGMALRTGQAAAGVYRGYRESPKANYYANSGTSSPSCLIELGFITSEKDNDLFDTRHKQMCAELVKASCRFLDVAYKAATMPELPTAPDNAGQAPTAPPPTNQTLPETPPAETPPITSPPTAPPPAGQPPTEQLPTEQPPKVCKDCEALRAQLATTITARDALSSKLASEETQNGILQIKLNKIAELAG